MEGFSTSIKAQLYDRIANPLSGSLIISWVLWNYKFLFILFSAEPVSIRFELIRDVYYQKAIIDIYFMQVHTLHWVKFGVVLPFLFAMLYIFIYPLVSLPVYRFSLWAQNKFIDAKNISDKKKRLTVEESAAIVEESYLRKQDYETKLSKYESDNIALQKKLEELRGSLFKLDGENKNIESHKSEIAKLNQIIDDLKQSLTNIKNTEPEKEISENLVNRAEHQINFDRDINATFSAKDMDFIFSTFHMNLQSFPEGTGFYFKSLFEGDCK